LVVGATGVAAELCKNIVLAGIHSLTLMDDQPVTIADLSAQFLIGVADIGENVSGGKGKGCWCFIALAPRGVYAVRMLSVCVRVGRCALPASCLCSN
jgi:molybdopterin/thiamine biosynthesis adenylyltransferase